MLYWLIIVLAVVVSGIVCFRESSIFIGILMGLATFIVLGGITVLVELSLMESNSFTEEVDVNTYDITQLSIGTEKSTSTTYINVGGTNGVGTLVPITSSSSTDYVNYLNVDTGNIDKVKADKSKLYYNESDESSVTIHTRKFKGITSLLFNKDSWESEYIFNVPVE